MQIKLNRIFCSLVIITWLFIGERTKAQAGSGGIFSKGDNIIGVGVGLGNFSNYGSGNGFTQTPSLMLTFEHAAIESGGRISIGFGGYLSYISSSNSWKDTSKLDKKYYSYTDSYQFEFLMARVSFHYKVSSNSKIDPYGGLTFGYVLDQHNLATGDPNVSRTGDPGNSAYLAQFNSPIEYGAYLGARYYFSASFGIWGELVIMNNAYNYIGLGLNIKFGNAAPPASKKTTTPLKTRY